MAKLYGGRPRKSLEEVMLRAMKKWGCLRLKCEFLVENENHNYVPIRAVVVKNLKNQGRLFQVIEGIEEKLSGINGI